MKPVDSFLNRAELVSKSEAETHAEVAAFLSCPASYPHHPDEVRVVETHTALVFLAGECVYKLKRPIALDFLDCRSLEARRRNCQSEFAANHRLAPGVYLGNVPVTREADGTLAISGSGTPVDWLVVMRRLDQANALDQRIAAGLVSISDVDRVCRTLAQFYLSQPPIMTSPVGWIALWKEKVAIVRASLSDPSFGLPENEYQAPLQAIEQFLARSSGLLTTRLAQGRIVDGHGDLKPEHVYIGEQVLIIDCLEFDERLRWEDPFDEIVFLGLECRRLGAPWIAPRLVDQMARLLGERPPEELLRFYRTYRACMRARLMIEHLRDEAPRTPEEWPRKARLYLKLATEALSQGDQS